MKTDRLLFITLYLMNHEIVSAKKLSKRFEVSERTIQRDINALCLAGVPVYSQQGINGGYKLMENFTIQKQFMDEEEIKDILQSLIASNTALPDIKKSSLIEKIKTIDNNTSLAYSMDFGSAHENKEIIALNTIFLKAIKEKKSVRMSYINSKGVETSRIAQPLKIQYKWYGWYLAAFCTSAKDLRIFKIARISKIDVLDIAPPYQDSIPDNIFDRIIEIDNRKTITIKLRCTRKAKLILMEHIPSESIDELNDDTFEYRKTLPENERFWYGLLLSLSDEIKVIEPESLIDRIKEDYEKIKKLYKYDK